MEDPLAVKSQVLEHIDPKGREEKVTDMAEITPVKSLLGIDTPSETEHDQLKYIQDFVSEGKKLEIADLLTRIKGIEQKLAPPALGETRLGKLYGYVKALQQAKSSRKVAEAYEA